MKVVFKASGKDILDLTDIAKPKLRALKVFQKTIEEIMERWGLTKLEVEVKD